MASKCPRCEKTVYFAEKVQSMGKAWHKLCLKCERCNKILNPAGHAEHEGRPYCHMPCYAALFSGSGFGSEHKARGGTHDTIPDTPVPTISSSHPASAVTDPEPKAEEKRAYREANIPEAPPMRGAYREANVPEAPPTRAYPQATIPEAPPLKSKGGFAEDSTCPRCCKKVYSGAKVRSLGKDWHHHCLRCLRCFKKLEPENHEEHDGEAFCYVPCYAIAMGAKGVNLGGADLHSRGPGSDGHARHPPQVPETYDRHPRDGYDRNAPRAALDVYDPHDRHLRVPSDAHDRYHPRGPPDVQHPRWPTSDLQDRGRGSARGTGSEERIHHIHHHTHTHSHTHTHTKK